MYLYERIKIKFRAKRWEFIQYVINKYNLKSYLEIGVSNRQCFDQITGVDKIGVDPSPKSKVLEMTSDEFFSKNTKKFDVIFIDGLHYKDQVIKDIENSLKVLNEGGFIFMHDCNPFSEKMQSVPRETTIWTGDVWKSFVYFRNRNDLKMCVIDADYGVGVIQKGKQEKIFTNNPTYNDLTKNRRKWLNLMTFKRFRRKFI